MGVAYWLVKSEPDVFGWVQMERGVEPWTQGSTVARAQFVEICLTSLLARCHKASARGRFG